MQIYYFNKWSALGKREGAVTKVKYKVTLDTCNKFPKNPLSQVVSYMRVFNL